MDVASIALPPNPAVTPTTHPACLPWYDFDEIRPFTDTLWGWLSTELQDCGFDHVPERLAREVDHNTALQHPNLLLSQTCGLLAVGRARDLVQIVATPRYRAPGCEGGRYRSFVVVRSGYQASDLGDMRNSRCAINEPWSHSGMNALRMLVAPMHHEGRFFAEVLESGSHVRSLEMIATGAADIAAIDCVTYALVRRHRPGLLEATRVLAETEPAPAPPFVTSLANTNGRVEKLREALRRFLSLDHHAEVRQQLLLDGIEVHSAAAYGPMLNGERQARALGYRDMPYRNEPG